MATFNERVVEIVNRYLAKSTGATANIRVENAFRAIQADRQLRCLNDSATVAAEHYLFTRYLTGSSLLIGTPYFLMSPLINIGYDLVKTLGKAAGVDPGVTDCPTSEAHCWIRMWSHLGAGDGFLDRRKTVPASPSPKESGFNFVCYPHEAPAN